MKTNCMACTVKKIRVAMICLALLGMTAGEFRLGESLAARFGQATARQTECPQVPGMGLADLMAAAR